ncbi:MAG: STAS domain-containing protein [Lentisphaerae bacterium]|nr:STAS domain-containing protein [Lentisphaerota bacterium]
MNMRMEIRNGKGVATVNGPLNAAGVDTFREQMQKWMAEHETIEQIVLDAGEMDYIDSAGLGVLIALLKRVTERGGDIRIARLGNKARMVFEITRAFKIFEIFDTVEEALGAEA